MHWGFTFTVFITWIDFYVHGLITPEDLASTYSLTVSTTLPFPTATLSSSDADQFLIDNWTLNKNKIQNQPSDASFVSDPFPNSPVNPALSSSNTSSPVLQVTYPEGSFEDSNGGIQFYTLFNGSLPSPQSMLLSYELAFDKGFQWVKGGKLPGLRGGKDTDGCEGGNLPNGTDCWSARLMWRTLGEAEIYTYIPVSDNLCNDADVICNSDFGTSLNRGAVSYTSGEWIQVALLVQLNSRGNLANGNMALFFNGGLVTNQTNLQIRSSTSLSADGLFFSTFFGGNDPSWATPLTQNTYFRQFRLWASENPSNLTGIPVSSTIRSQPTYMIALAIHGTHSGGVQGDGHDRLDKRCKELSSLELFNYHNMPQYIILFKSEATKEQIQSCKEDLIANGGHVTKDNFGDLMKGIAADVPQHYVKSLQNFSPDGPIEYIEPDGEVRTQ